MKDFNAKQAQRWIDQEFAKINTKEEAVSMIENTMMMRSDKDFEQYVKENLPNSYAAKNKLMEMLREKFKI